MMRQGAGRERQVTSHEFFIYLLLSSGNNLAQLVQVVTYLLFALKLSNNYTHTLNPLGERERHLVALLVSSRSGEKTRRR